MKKCIIMRGIQGVGKTTLIQKLWPGSLVCSADMYYSLGGRPYRYDPAKVQEAHKWCFVSFMDAIDLNNETVIIDNTNIRAWEIAPYEKIASLNDYHVKIVEVVPKRLDEVVKRNIHGVPEFLVGIAHESFNREHLPRHWNVERWVSQTLNGEPEFVLLEKPTR